MSFAQQTEPWFNEISSLSFAGLSATEDLSLSLSGEAIDYVRFNKALVRQNTNVEQRVLDFTFQSLNRSLNFKISLSGVVDDDMNALRSLIERARQEVKVLQEDPFLVPMKNNGTSREEFSGSPPSGSEVISYICDATSHVDMAGFFAGGELVRANQNSKGQKHWFAIKNFFFDFSLYTVNKDGENKAVKSVYSGTVWDQNEFKNKIQDCCLQLKIMERPSQNISRGNYRVYLAPGAVSEILGTASWRGLGYAAYKRGQSALNQLIEGKKSLSPLLTLKENFALGLTRRFNEWGELAPDSLNLVENGKVQNLLINAKSAKEFSVIANGAAESEALRSPEINSGDLKPKDILARLETGIYINNLHYINWSDLQSARITGMTRYACFWVEKGEIVGPIRDLRFDETLYRCWGTELEALTTHSEIDPAIGTYFEREIGGRKIPGMLLRDFAFTL